MSRSFRVLLTMIAAAMAATAQVPQIAVTSAFDGAAGPFVRTEMIRVDITGVEPLRPITLFAGVALPTPWNLPGFDGQFAIDPNTVVPFGPYDGLGIFGGSFPLAASSAGTASLVIRIPMGFGAPGPLPASLTIQAISARNPFTTGNAFVFSQVATLAVDEPVTQPSVGALSTQVVQEGASTTLIITGGGFIPESTIQPQVTFFSTTVLGEMSEADSVRVIDEDPGPGIVPALEVVCPPILGMPQSAPMTTAGPTLIEISYSNSGLYNSGSPNASVTTSPAGFADPTFLVYQTATAPSFTSIDPKANLVTGGCTTTITGADFLSGASVFFDFGGPSETAATALVASSTSLTVLPPALPSSLVGVVVRNVDHFPSSPRETVLAPPATDFAIFETSILANVTVTGVTPPSIVEGVGGGLVTIAGTCPSVGGYTALDLGSGATAVLIGSNLAGTDASSPAAVTAITTPTPGQFEIDVVVPNVAPGLNPPGVTANGIGNAGIKQFQIIPPACLNPAAQPHLPFVAIPGSEPLNEFTYLAPFAPTITQITPNNASRVDGGQMITIVGNGFFTNDTVLPSSNTALLGFKALGGTIAETGLGSVTLIDENTITATTPDLSALSLVLPMQVDTILRNPDGQEIPTAGAADDFIVVASLSETVASSFAPTGFQLLDTGTAGTPTNVFTFDADVILDASLILQAFGTGPVIIRCRGNVTLDGVIDLGGDVFAGAPGPFPAPGAPPAGGGIRGLGGDTTLLQPPTAGLEGLGPYDPLLMVRFNAFGVGGLHNPVQGGGGGGGGMATVGIMGLGMDGGPTGGLGGTALGFADLPIPILGAANGTESFYPPGGSGGAAGGLGTGPPYFPGQPSSSLGLSGSGGNGGGAVCIAADGVVTITGTILTNGAPGAPGTVDTLQGILPGGGGGGGSGGAVLIQAIQGIVISPTAFLTANGGTGGLGAIPGINDGGAGSAGMIRFALPALAQGTPQVDGAASVTPAAATTGY